MAIIRELTVHGHPLCWSGYGILFVPHPKYLVNRCSILLVYMEYGLKSLVITENFFFRRASSYTKMHDDPAHPDNIYTYTVRAFVHNSCTHVCVCVSTYMHVYVYVCLHTRTRIRSNLPTRTCLRVG